MLQVTYLLLLKVADGCLNGILRFPEVLVLVHGSSKIVRKEVVNDMIDHISKGHFRIEEALLLSGDGWAYIVNLDSGEWVCVDGISFVIGARHLGLYDLLIEYER
jgi:hypothetical protein